MLGFLKKVGVFVASLILILLLNIFLFSCGGDAPTLEGDLVSFTDALGREVTVRKNPERVAALIGSFADVWVLSGGELCAAAEDAKEDFGLSLDGAVNIGGAHSPSLELLLSADPELVLASASTASNLDMKDTLEAVGITVAYFDVDNFEDYLAMLEICTRITGRADLYEKNGLAIKREIDLIKAEFSSADIPEEMRKILLLRTSQSSVKAKGSHGTILGEMLSDLGCINIADSDSGLLENLGVESVIREEPYRIFAVAMGNNTEAAVASLENMIKENPAWQTLSAVRDGRLHIMDKSLFNLKPNDRFAEAYRLLYEILTEE